MAWRKTGKFHAPVEVEVLTCDVCERDVGHVDGRRPQAHFVVTRQPNSGSLGDQKPQVVACSPECLRAFAASVTGPPRATSGVRSRPSGKSRR